MNYPGIELRDRFSVRVRVCARARMLVVTRVSESGVVGRHPWSRIALDKLAAAHWTRVRVRDSVRRN